VALAGEGKNHTRRNDAVSFHHHSTVVERGIRGEQIEQEFTAQLGIDAHPWVEKIFGPQITAKVDNNQGPTTALGETTGGVGELCHGASFDPQLAGGIGQQHPQPPGPQQLHQATQFPLPENRQRQRASQHKGFDQRSRERKQLKALERPSQGDQEQVTPQ